MKKGFTLIELVVVLIIVAVLGVLGLTQYTKLIEKARGAEAKEILGSLRKLAAAYYMEKGTAAGIVGADLGIGTGADQTPSACRASHYFSYGLNPDPVISTTTVVLEATRCTTGGKTPQGASAGTATLTSVLSTGVDTWGGTGGY